MPPRPKPEERKRPAVERKRAERPIVTALPAANGVPEPARPLGQEGERLWARVWRAGATWISPDTDAEQVLLICEATDERVGLRLRVIRDGDWRERVALRQLEAQIASHLGALGFTPTERSRFGFAKVKDTSQSRLAQLRAARGSS